MKKNFYVWFILFLLCCMPNLDYFDLLKVLSPPDLEGGGVEGVAGDEVLSVASQAVQLTQLLRPGEKSSNNRICSFNIFLRLWLSMNRI